MHMETLSHITASCFQRTKEEKKKRERTAPICVVPVEIFPPFPRAADREV